MITTLLAVGAVSFSLNAGAGNNDHAQGSSLGIARENLPTYETELEELVKHAKKLSGFGTPGYDAQRYHATLRQGLIQLSMHGMQSGRNTNAAPRPNMSAVVPSVVEGVDDNAADKKALLEAIEQGKQGMRIVGGSDVRKSWYTETVAIVEVFGKSRYCTGVVVESGKILTAAHCVCDMRLLPHQKGSAEVRFGDPDANNPPSGTPPWVNNSRTKMLDPDFCKRYKYGKGAICGGDLAVVEYSGNTPRHVIPAKIAKANDVPKHGQGTIIDKTSAIVGYGDTRRTGGLPRASRMANVGSTVRDKMYALIGIPPLSCSDSANHCTVGNKKYGCHLDDELILFDISRGRRDTCNGDSGGPVFKFRDHSKEQVVYAITSRGRLANGTCGAGGIYTSLVGKHIQDWLKKNAQ